MTPALSLALPSLPAAPEVVLLAPGQGALAAASAPGFPALLAAAQPAGLPAPAPPVPLAAAVAVAPGPPVAARASPLTAAQLWSLIDGEPELPRVAAPVAAVETAARSDVASPDAAARDALPEDLPEAEPATASPPPPILLAMPLPALDEKPPVAPVVQASVTIAPMPLRPLASRRDPAPVSPAPRDGAQAPTVRNDSAAASAMPAPTLRQAARLPTSVLAIPVATGLAVPAAPPAPPVSDAAVVPLAAPPAPVPALAAQAAIPGPLVAAAQPGHTVSAPSPFPEAVVTPTPKAVERSRKPIPGFDLASPLPGGPSPASAALTGVAAPSFTKDPGQGTPFAQPAPTHMVATRPDAAVPVATDRFGDVRIGLEGGAQDLKVSLSVAQGAPSLLAAEAPRLAADLAANGIRLQSLDVGGFGGSAPEHGAPRQSAAGVPPAPQTAAANAAFAAPSRAGRAATDRYA